jgi:hypothetical protein
MPCGSDPANSKHMILGYDHGMGITWDGGLNWYHPDEQPLAQLYSIGYDMMAVQRLRGLQDNGSVRGPSTKRGGSRIVFEDWQSVGGGDGMYNVVCPLTNRYLYNESQFGNISRTDLYTGETKRIRHTDQALRYNWNAPILISPHDPNVVYHAANKLLKSTSRGDSWVEISPDLTTNDKTKLTTGKGGDGNIQYCTITTIDESPVVKDLLYAGTDDGLVWVTKDGGKEWKKISDNIKGNPGYWVSRVVASSIIRAPLTPPTPAIARRLQAVRLQDDGLRRDMDIDSQQPARPRGQRDTRRPEEPEPALRWRGVRRIRVNRWRQDRGTS